METKDRDVRLSIAHIMYKETKVIQETWPNMLSLNGFVFDTHA